MNLQDLKQKSPPDLLSFAEELEIENASTLRKQDMLFAILKQLAEYLEMITLLFSLKGLSLRRPKGPKRTRK